MVVELTQARGTAAVEHVVEIDGAPVHYLEAGEGDPLIVLHSAGGAAQWLPYHAELAKRHRVIAPDHPGFGRTPIADQVGSVSDIAFLYARFLDELGLDRVSVLGMSFGGWVAAELAVIDPARVTKLILINAIGLRVPGHPVADLFAMSAQEKAAGLFHDQALAAQIFGGEPDVDTIIGFYHDETAFARYAWKPFCANPDLHKRLWRITAPTLVLLGAEDRIVPRAHGERYAELIPNARLHVVPEAGHALPVESLEEGIAAIEQFLAS